jgi:hypothetical protein
MLECDCTHQRKPQSNAAVALSGSREAVEGFKDLLALILGDAGAAVADE